jgi:FtsZ-interacting cell division protein ZipA
VKNLFDFFFSFDKLMKEKLVIPFFWLALITWGLDFFSTALASIKLGILATIVNIVQFLVTILFALVIIRLVSEIAVAIFRINDNLSPDGGKSETADVDIIGETKKAAEAASKRARELTQTAADRTKSSVDNVKGSMDKSKPSTSSAKPTPTATSKAKATKKTSATKTAASSSSKSKTTTAKKTAAKKAPAKTAAVKKTTTKSAAPKKRGPKPGTKAPRDKDGNLLKKDGTPRKKPGPKKT